MNTTTIERRWGTVLNADVVGYSMLASRDELGAMRALIQTMHWLASEVEAFGGRVVDAPGDNLMAEFASEEAAILCALHVQRLLQAWHPAPSREVPIRFRIGINSGPLLARAGRIYGNTVNVAARLQQAAPCGGVLVSETSCYRIPVQLAAGFGDYTQIECRNIPCPIGTLRASL
jgi:adenylate cyclase